MVLEHWLGFPEEMEWQLHTHPTKAILLQLKKILTLSNQAQRRVKKSIFYVPKASCFGVEYGLLQRRNMLGFQSTLLGEVFAEWLRVIAELVESHWFSNTTTANSGLCKDLGNSHLLSGELE